MKRRSIIHLTHTSYHAFFFFFGALLLLSLFLYRRFNLSSTRVFLILCPWDMRCLYFWAEIKWWFKTWAQAMYMIMFYLQCERMVWLCLSHWHLSSSCCIKGDFWEEGTDTEVKQDDSCRSRRGLVMTHGTEKMRACAWHSPAYFLLSTTHKQTNTHAHKSK